MAAAGGGLSFPGNVSGSTTPSVARARFPGRPWTPRSRLRSEKRPQRGRLGLEAGEVVTGGPRPINIGLTLSEDPSLVRLLGIAEKHKRQRAAGFNSSGSEEEEDFTGFGTEYRPLLAAHNISQSSSLRRSLLKPEKPPPPPDLSSNIKMAGNISKEDTQFGVGPELGNARKPQKPAKMAANKTSGVQSTGRQATCTKAIKCKDSTNSDSSDGKRDIEKAIPSATVRKGNRQYQTTKVGRVGRISGSRTAQHQSSRDKRGKLVWTLTVVKGKGKASKGKEPGEVTTGDTEVYNAEPERSGKRRRGSQQRDIFEAQARSGNGQKSTDIDKATKGVALSPTPVNKQEQSQQRNVSEKTEKSPEAATRGWS
ncbi:hypothetical protein UPYG_G00341970 [Umbra pygmaea]|uniref:Uncharacterized protein n=1 Tax=Umbra pygmaea TaxID=75934 RepID=A0ABD0WBD1_UMBPY